MDPGAPLRYGQDDELVPSRFGNGYSVRSVFSAAATLFW